MIEPAELFPPLNVPERPRRAAFELRLSPALKTLALCGAAAVGGAIGMFFLDPVSGRGRTARLRDRARGLKNRLFHRLEKQSRNTLNHLKGAVAVTLPGARTLMRRHRTRSELLH